MTFADLSEAQEYARQTNAVADQESAHQLYEKWRLIRADMAGKGEMAIPDVFTAIAMLVADYLDVSCAGRPNDRLGVALAVGEFAHHLAEMHPRQRLDA